jgi:hypothetical protein
MRSLATLEERDGGSKEKWWVVVHTAAAGWRATILRERERERGKRERGRERGGRWREGKNANLNTVKQ